MELTDVDVIVNDILAPLRGTLAKIDAEIAEHEAAIVTLKQTRAKPARILAAAERTPPKPGSRPNVVRGVSQERVDAVADWLRANTDGEAFHASGLDRRADFDILGSQSQISKALNKLADRGLVRLDHTGTGGAKFYKLVGAR